MRVLSLSPASHPITRFACEEQLSCSSLPGSQPVPCLGRTWPAKAAQRFHNPHWLWTTLADKSMHHRRVFHTAVWKFLCHLLVGTRILPGSCFTGE